MNIKEIEGYKAVKFDNPAVAVITYALDNDVITHIGIVKEKNPHFASGYSENLIMGGVEPGDTSLLHRAMIEMKEEAGIEVSDSLKWSYLGEIYSSKLVPDPIYIFAVNVTGQKMASPKGDQDSNEKILSFVLKPVDEALLSADSLLQTAFFKLFMKIYQKQIKDSQCTTYPTENSEERLQENSAC